MFGIENYTGFLVAGILLNLTPGQDTVYIIGRSIAQGRKAGIASVLGIATGSIVHTIAAALGLSVILFSYPIVFEVVKYLGAGYLVYLGCQMILSSSKQKNEIPGDGTVSIYQIYKKGIFTNILNPKVALFFIAFLPQFVDSRNSYGILPFLILGFTFVFTGTIWCLLLALFSSWFSRSFRENPGVKVVLDKICGIVFIGLGIKLFLTKR